MSPRIANRLRSPSGRRRLLRIKSCCVAFLLVFLFGWHSVLLRAQFQQPSDEELKMASDPKAPGAAAVYLYREEIVDDTRGFESTYERIKVLGEKGFDLATVRLPYAVGFDDKPEIQGRTIHADGKVIPFTGKPSELVDLKAKNFQVNSRVVTLPDVEVGSILEFRIKTHRNTFAPLPFWTIQQPYYVRKAHYSFKCSSMFHPAYEAMLGSGDKVVFDKKGEYTLDLTDIPPLPDEEQMPPLNLIQWRVQFYYTEFSTTAAFWDNAAQLWGKGADELTKSTPTLKKAVAGIVSPGDSDETKARKIYAAVMALENTDFAREKTKAERKKEKLKDVKTLDDIWNQKSGSSDALALLYVAMGHAADLTVWPMEVVDRERALFDNGYLNVHQLDDYIAIADLNGKEVYLDPGEKMCPFGILHWKHTLTTGFRLTAKGGVLARTPPGNFQESALDRVAVLKIDGAGNVNGTARFIMSGPSALYWRQMTLSNDTDEIKKEFNDSMKEYFPEGVVPDFDHFLGLDDYSVNLLAIVKVSGSLGSITGKHLFLPGLFFESHVTHPFVTADKRFTPVDMHYAHLTEDDVTYYLPPGYSVESMPAAAAVSWPDKALLKIKSKANEGVVQVVRSLAYNFAMLDPREYPDLHGFYQKVATADQQQIVLARTTSAKGN
jgi:hypothetical protein